MKLLYDIIRSYKARECTLEMDGADHSGKFLLVEIMNTRSVGPNLDLNPGSDTGDGEFEVITVPESQREKLLAYIDARINDKEEPFFFNVLKAKKVRMRWQGIHIHADDEILKLKSPVEVMVDVREKVFDFLVPDHNTSIK